jgi:hypothetical protein
MEEEHDLADITKANEPADFFTVDSPSGKLVTTRLNYFLTTDRKFGDPRGRRYHY